MNTPLSSPEKAARTCHPITCEFLANARRVRAIVRIIQENTTTNYITHSEVIEHRAEHTRRWAHFRRSLLARDIKKAIARRKRSEGGILIATRGRRLLGVAVLLFDRRHRYGVVEDIVVDAKARGQGIGAELMREAQAEMRAAGMAHVVLESGIRNRSAHAFFRHEGFREAAVMFLKKLAA